MVILIVVAIVLIVLAIWSKLIRDIVYITLITIFITAIAYDISNTNFFKVYVYPESFAIDEFEATDYAFAKLRPQSPTDERILLVNIGNLERRDIAKQINIISKLKPKVIAIDALFNCEKGLRDSVNCPQLIDIEGNLMLRDAFKEAGNVILGSKLLQSDSLAKIDSNEADSIEISDPMFSDYIKHGFVTLPTNAMFQEDVKLCRTIFPSRIVNGKRELAFAAQIAMQYDSSKALAFLARNKEEELINFRRNILVQEVNSPTPTYRRMFYVVDTDHVLTGTLTSELVQDKIVIMGYLGDYLGDPAFEHKFYTPLNPKFTGRANPDMFGSVIQANVVAMILNEDCLNELSILDEFLVGFFACLFHVALLLFIFKRWPIWYDIAAIGLVVLQLGFFSAMRLYLFSSYNYKTQLLIGVASLAVASIMVVVYKDLFPHLRSKFRRQSTKS
jgi:CHASE2 domain-containing sensor protein